MAFFGLFSPAQSQSIYPLRGVISPDAQQQTFTISNPSEHTRDITVSWLELSAQANGTYEPTAPALVAGRNASSYLTVTPARFVLLPGTTQTVTVRLSGEKPFPKRERRSHLLVRSSPAPHLLKRTTGKLPVDMVTGVSVPVFVTDDTSLGHVTIHKVGLSRLMDGGLSATVELERTGTTTVYGAVRVVGRLTPESAPQTLVVRENVAVFSETPERNVTIPLGLATLPAGQLEVIFEGRGKHRGKTLARRIFNVGPPPKA